MMQFMKNFLRKGKKSTETAKTGEKSGENGTSERQTQVPVRKISDREIALGYMLW